MEQAISRLVHEIRKQLKEEIRKQTTDGKLMSKNSIQKVKKGLTPVNTQSKDQVRQALHQIQQEIKTIRVSLSKLEEKQLNNTNSNYSQSMNLSHYRVPSHLDDHQMQIKFNLFRRQVLYNPEEASTPHQPRHKRRSHYDEVYQEAEKRIEYTGRNTHNVRSKISKLIHRDRLASSSVSQRSF